MSGTSAPGDAGDRPRTDFAPPAWLRLLSNLPLLLGIGVLLSGGVNSGGETLILGGLFSAGMLVIVARSFLLRVTAGEDVEIVNWRQTERYPWSDVTRFEYDRAGLWVVRRSGERVAVKAFSFGRALPPVQRRGKDVAEKLEELRRTHRGRGTVTVRGRKVKKKR